jgi:hypothetical protein
MQPQYLTVSSSGGTYSSPWKLVNWHATSVINLGISVQSSGGNYQVDVTMDDPTRTTNPTLAASVAVTVFPSTACAGGGITPAAANGFGTITRVAADLDQHNGRRHHNRNGIAVRHPMTESDPVAIGRAAWQRLRNRDRATWSDWRLVAVALQAGRSHCLKQAKTNRPFGIRYTRAFAAWLLEHGFQDLAKQEIWSCLKLLSNPAIGAWRASLKANGTEASSTIHTPFCSSIIAPPHAPQSRHTSRS